jgi:hypothetical protein
MSNSIPSNSLSAKKTREIPSGLIQSSQDHVSHILKNGSSLKKTITQLTNYFHSHTTLLDDISNNVSTRILYFLEHYIKSSDTSVSENRNKVTSFLKKQETPLKLPPLESKRKDTILNDLSETAAQLSLNSYNQDGHNLRTRNSNVDYTGKKMSDAVKKGARDNERKINTKKPIDDQIKDIILEKSSASNQKLKIMDCLKSCIKYYHQNKQAIDSNRQDFGEWQALVSLLIKNKKQSTFIHNESQTKPTPSSHIDGLPYSKKTGEHEFIQRQHLVQAFLRSINQEPGFSPESNGVTWLDVYESLQVDTLSLMFYDLDDQGTPQEVTVLYREGCDPTIVDDNTTPTYEGDRLLSEVLITGTGHAGAAYARTDEETKAQRKEEGVKNPGIKQSTTGTGKFHDELKDAFYNSENPGDLVLGLYKVFTKHCYNGQLPPARCETHVKHVSDVRRHSKSRKERKTFALEMSTSWAVNKVLFFNVAKKAKVENQLKTSSETPTFSDKGSKGTPESDLSNEEPYW